MDNQKKKIIIVISVFLITIFAFFLIRNPQQEVNAVQPSQEYTFEDRQIFKLEAAPATKEIDGKQLTLFTYNNQFPGPLLRVKQGSNLFIDFLNNLDQDTTIHWHGLRHNYKFDGVPDVSQPPVRPGGSFRYELYFPDAGVFWYHPHMREDIQQERGMYGMILVESEGENKGDGKIQEIPLILDDMLLDEKGFFAFSEDFTNFALMGRFGNQMLLNGEVQPTISVKQGDLLRFYLLNTANVRPFNTSIEKTAFTTVGSDLSAYEKPMTATNVIIAPAERYILETSFSEAGEYKIMHTNPDATYVLGKILVEQNTVKTKKESRLPKPDIAPYKKYFIQQPDFEFELDIDMRGMKMDMEHMHGAEDKIEWEDTMFMMNQMHNNLMMSWFIEEKKTGKRNMDIMAEVNQGDVKIIRIVNNAKSEHPMQHPIHLHGQRFLVVRQDGKENANLVWKDTVLIPKGSTVDMLVDFSNPGVWMMHCHIAEHLHSGMMMGFTVKETRSN